MPGLNKTGPEGQGPRTGRKMGKCKPRKGSEDESANQDLLPDSENYRMGRFRRQRFGRRRN